MKRFIIRPVRPDDIGTVLEMIRGLARFESLEDSVTCSEEDLRRAMFGPSPTLHGVLAFEGRRAVGVATYYYVYSTFRGRKYLYLEDIYTTEQVRGQGVGHQLMAHIAARAKADGCAGMRWLVLDWNERAIRFYESLGATRDSEWVPYSLSGSSFERVAAMADARLEVQPG